MSNDQGTFARSVNIAHFSAAAFAARMRELFDSLEFVNGPAALAPHKHSQRTESKAPAA